MGEWIKLNKTAVPIKSVICITKIHTPPLGVFYTVELKGGKTINVSEAQDGSEWCYLRLHESLTTANKAKCAYNRHMDALDE